MRDWLHLLFCVSGGEGEWVGVRGAWRGGRPARAATTKLSVGAPAAARARSSSRPRVRASAPGQGAPLALSETSARRICHGGGIRTGARSLPARARRGRAPLAADAHPVSRSALQQRNTPSQPQRHPTHAPSLALALRPPALQRNAIGVECLE
jgi:hypothetical protein